MSDNINTDVDYDEESAALAENQELEFQNQESNNFINTFLEHHDFRDSVKHDLRAVVRTAVMRAECLAVKGGVRKDSGFYNELEYIMCEAVKEGVHDYFYQRGYNNE
jgi:hypothetical protein